MITPKVLEPESDSAELAALREIAEILRDAEPSAQVVAAKRHIANLLATIDSRPHRGLVDYDQRIHG